MPFARLMARACTIDARNLAVTVQADHLRFGGRRNQPLGQLRRRLPVLRRQLIALAT